MVTVKNHDFRLTRVLKESNSWQVEWTVIFEADMISTNPPRPAILKFRYESVVEPTFQSTELTYPTQSRLDPFCFDLFDDIDTLNWSLEDAFEKEWQAIQECEGSGHTPCYIAHEAQPQSKEYDPYPDGVVRIIAMTKIEGVPIFELEAPQRHNGRLDLTVEEVEGLWQQIVHVSEYETGLAYSPLSFD